MPTKPELAFEALKQSMLGEEFPSGSRLPSFPNLRKSLGISRNTLLAALDMLEKEGLIIRKEKIGVFVRGQPDWQNAELPGFSPRQSKGELLASDLKTAISQGKLRVGAFLPAAKVIQYQYQSSPATVRKAIGILLNMGMLHRRGRAYVIGPIEKGLPQPRNKALLLSGGTALATGFLADNTVNWRFVQSLASTMHDLGLFLEKGGTFENPDADVLPGNPKLKQTMGIVCVFSDLVFDRLLSAGFGLFENLLKRAERLSLPLVVYKRTAFPAGILKNAKKYRRFFPIATAIANPGKSVGQYLALSGHKRVAMFAFTKEIWDKQRIEGAQLGHKNVLGTGSRIVVYAANQDYWDFFAKHSPENKQPNFARFMEQEHNGFVFQNIGPTNPYWDAKEFVKQLMWKDHLRTVMTPMFERALNNMDCSAWICADPEVAIAASIFLEEKKVRIPHDLSLISMDDRKDLVPRGITAFSFQAEQLGYLAAHCIAGDIPVKRKRNGMVDCPGRIIERGSVGRV